MSTWWSTAYAEMSRAGAQAVSLGLVLASGGNLSARQPGSDEMAITARGAYLDRLDETSFVRVRLSGDDLSGVGLSGDGLSGDGLSDDGLPGGSLTGDRPSGDERGEGEPSSEWRLHQRTYLARPDVNAIVHLHPEHAVLLDALGKPIRLLTLDHVAYVGEIARVPFYPNGSRDLADAAAQASIDSDCVLLAHHGCSALGATTPEAFRRAVNLESAARATYRMLLLGDETTEFPPNERSTALHSGPDDAASSTGESGRWPSG